MEQAERRFDEIVERLASHGVEPTKMFGKRCLKADGKGIAALDAESMAFKLGGDAHAQALTLEGAKLWDPSGKHRPMKEWIQVPLERAEEWPQLAMQALAYLRA